MFAPGPPLRVVAPGVDTPRTGATLGRDFDINRVPRKPNSVRSLVRGDHLTWAMVSHRLMATDPGV